MSLDLDVLLAADGQLSRLLPGYAPRPQQLAMAKAVARAIDKQEILVSEAGTGVGKTYAYLLPALASKGSVVVSTGTRNLQDQLFCKDLPLVSKVVGEKKSIALLKGRSNYLCLLRLDGLPRRERNPQLRRVRQWADTTASGDIGELAGIPEDSMLWRQLTSTVDSCLGQDCPRVRDCHLVRARRRAQDADLVVVNHHLLLADMNLRREGVSDLLPQADAFVIDEAHQIYDTASRFFGTALSGRQLQELAADVDTEHLRSGGKVSERPEVGRDLEKAVLDMRLALGNETRRVAWSELREQSAVTANLNTLREALVGLQQWLEQSPQDQKGLSNCRDRCDKLSKHLHLVCAAEPDDFVRWVDVQQKGFVLNATPMDISGLFQESMQSYGGAWVFTSATLTVGGDFGHFCGRLGLTATQEQCLDSPFDYRRNAVLYHPEGLPEPNDKDYTRRLVELVVPVIRAARGRTFLLFTSYRALREAEAQLQGRVDYPLLVQGTLARNELLNRFRHLGNAVLLGTSSFWEGVDVRGDALSCVIIDRLPFAAPGDPVLAARIHALRAAGGNPFRDYQLPAAVITLKQGVGRLIRDVGDKGVMVLCDPRLLGRDYGRVFLDSVPPMTRTRKLEVVERFFDWKRRPAVRILCVDTSTEACSAAVYVDGRICARMVIEPRAHADLILKMIATVMDEAGVRTARLTAVAFGCGPGSFTGIRIGTSVALAIAFAHQHPVIPVSCLAALAQGAIRERAAQRIVTATDARMGEVYCGLFEQQEGRAVAIAAERLCEPHRLGNLPQGSWFGVGSAWSQYASVLRGTCGPGLIDWRAERYPHAQDMVLLAAHELKCGRVLSASEAHPVYLRDRVAEKRVSRP